LKHRALTRGEEHLASDQRQLLCDASCGLANMRRSLIRNTRSA
jgi:hypothetical protein